MIIRCQEAKDLIKACLKFLVKDNKLSILKGSVITDGKNVKEIIGYNISIHREAFRHIRECREEKCSELWRELNGVIQKIDHNLELLTDEDGLLPFSY